MLADNILLQEGVIYRLLGGCGSPLRLDFFPSRFRFLLEYLLVF